MSKDARVIVALDFPHQDQALEFVNKIDPDSCRLKVGKELFTAAGPQFVEKLVGLGHDVFLDLKFHDIPNTVKSACRVAAELGVWMMNVHALGGQAMLEAAKEGVVASSNKDALLIAVTILTSMDDAAISQIGLQGSPQDNVLRLAALTQASGLDGVVCSAQEASLLRKKLDSDFLLVTPGIRPANSQTGDQKRIMTPKKAIEQGSSYLVIGRPITQSEDPRQALDEINAEIN